MLVIRRLKQEEESPRKKISKVIKLGVVLLLAIFFLEIWVVNRLSTYGYKIAELKNLQGELELENQILENEISQNSSLTTIEQKAVEFGFKYVTLVDYYRPPNIASAR